MYYDVDKRVNRLLFFQIVTNPFGDGGGDMKQYHHPRCIFETFLRARATTKTIQDSDDLENYSVLNDDDKKLLKTLIDGIKNLCLVVIFLSVKII